MLLSVILPTMNRLFLLEQTINSLVETTQNYNVELIVIIDEDKESVNFIIEHVSTQINNLKVIYNHKRSGALSAWNQGLAISTGDMLFPAGDDSLFYGRWLDYALESHQEKLGGFGAVGLNDLAYDGNLQLATTLLYDRRFCKEILGGVIAFPVYHYFCVDSEINARAKNAGKFYWDDRAKVEHIHPAHGKRLADASDLLKIDNEWMEKDNLLFEERKLAGFPNNFESII